jgi:regulator of sirC expression with transglutaminase-like and TPR domain
MLDTLLDQLAIDPAADVDPAEVAVWLAGDEYPELDLSGYFERLADLADRARPYLRGDLEQQVEGLSVFLFEEEGFQGNTDEYYDPQNSYLTDVLDRRLGIPITLSVLAMSVGRRAGLDVVGVGLPGHFIAKAVAGDEEILFDPFHGGQLLTPDGCEQLITAVTGREFAATPALLAPTPPGLIVTRMLNNLRSIYADREDFARTARVLRRQRQLAPDDPGLRRDLGVTLVRSGRPGPAVDHLRAYLAVAAGAPDADDVRLLLKRALTDVARWN